MCRHLANFNAEERIKRERRRTGGTAFKQLVGHLLDFADITKHIAIIINLDIYIFF